MSPEDIDKLTIAEVRAISERASDALSKFREVQAMLGGGAGSVSADASQGPPPAVSGRPPTRTIGEFNGFNAREMAERERLLKRNRGEDLPDAIRQMEAEQ